MICPFFPVATNVVFKHASRYRCNISLYLSLSHSKENKIWVITVWILTLFVFHEKYTSQTSSPPSLVHSSAVHCANKVLYVLVLRIHQWDPLKKFKLLKTLTPVYCISQDLTLIGNGPALNFITWAWNSTLVPNLIISFTINLLMGLALLDWNLVLS